METLGVVAHRGGLLVRRPELTVGVVRAISRPSGLEVELLARRPLDRRGATERQQDVRAAKDANAPRRLLPAFDEGIDLRLGVLDQADRPRWHFPMSWYSSSGDHYQGTFGPSYRTVYELPPAFDQISLVFAWPEIGFPETVITLPLPDQATVERTSTSIWQAPVEAVPVPNGLNHHVAAHHDEVAVEEGTIVATPRVLHRGDHAAIVLTRLTAVDSVLSAELLSIATGAAANAIAALRFRPFDEPSPIRANGQGASLAVVRGRDAFWVRPGSGSFSGGDRIFSGTQDFTLRRPDGDLLDLVVAWPLAGLDDARTSLPLSQI